MRMEHRDICGRYRLLRKVGEGGTGVVCQAIDLRLGRPVALKALHDSSLNLEREGHSLAQIDHPNVVALHDVIEDAGRQYLVMEYVDGPTLEDSLAERGSLGLERAIDLTRRIGAVVAHAHDRGVLHCDLKPANVLLTREGEIKLSDFTLARVLTSGRFDGPAGGSAPYAAPEQFGAEVGPWTDVYGLGVMLQRLAGPLTAIGAPGDPGDEIARQVAGVIRRATAPNPSDRFPSMRDFLAALPAELAPAVPAAYGVTRLTGPSPLADFTRLLPAKATRVPRRWPLGVLCAALALMLAAISAHFTVFASPARVMVPGLVATQAQSAAVVARSLDLRLHVTHRYAAAPAGTVLVQQPLRGSDVTKGTILTLVVSKGPAPVTVPDLSEVKQQEAITTLRHQGFTVVVHTQETISRPAGLVLSQVPAPPARLLPGSTVTITVSVKPWWWIF
jgi:serine/threonine protein kinase